MGDALREDYVLVGDRWTRVPRWAPSQACVFSGRRQLKRERLLCWCICAWDLRLHLCSCGEKRDVAVVVGGIWHRVGHQFWVPITVIYKYLTECIFSSDGPVTHTVTVSNELHMVLFFIYCTYRLWLAFNVPKVVYSTFMASHSYCRYNLRTSFPLVS